MYNYAKKLIKTDKFKFSMQTGKMVAEKSEIIQKLYEYLNFDLIFVFIWMSFWQKDHFSWYLLFFLQKFGDKWDFSNAIPPQIWSLLKIEKLN